MQDVHVKLNARLPWQQQHSTRRSFHQQTELKFKEEINKLPQLEHSFEFYLELGNFGKWTRNNWKVLKCGAGEGW